MAEAFLGAAIQVVKWVGGPIIRQFNYLCCFTSNINNLEKEAKKFDDAGKGIQVQVDRALDDVRVIVPQVETWLANSMEIKDQKTTILDQVPNVGSGCLKLGARFSLSKTAKKTTERMKELRAEGKFDVISLPGPPAAREPVQLGKAYEFESRKQFEDDIMEILRARDVSMIGIFGMGGLGKTTMAKGIMNRVLKEHVFEETVIAVVSQQVDMHKIQREIGGSLGIIFEAKTTEAVIVQKLHARLTGASRILLVLDDVWEGIELEEFGIPRDSKDCTILITSRNRDALSAMGVQEEFSMGILAKDEAQFLFREKVGTCMDDAKLKCIAEGVVKECEGLPIALATVGATLKDEKNPAVWSDALHQLSQCDPDIPHFIAKVYNPLKLSYDFLSSKQAKSLFLLCCLFPEDANIDVERLTCFAMGLGIFTGIKILEEGRNRVSTLIKMLKSRSLLLDSEKSDDHVRMHDVVRDVCMFIAKQEGYVGGNECSWSSSFEIHGEKTEHPIGLEFPNLRLLFLSRGHDNMLKRKFKFDSAFPKGISNLYVLCIQSYQSLTSMALAHSLKNLNSLILYSCYELKTISVVGELVNLEILICRDCFSIEELPLEIKRLGHLKLLEFTRCKNLQRIGQGIISSLYALEELKMLNSFKKWESEERENVGLKELEALANLRCLEIEIEDPALAAEKMHLSSKIKRYRITIGTRGVAELEFNDHSYDKRMVVELKREDPCLGRSIGMQLLRDTEYLYLSGNGANSVDLAKCQNIRWLELTKCETMKNIITTSMVDDATAVPTSLEHLMLRYLPKLEGICDGPILCTSFHNLKELELFHLEALKLLWKSNNENIHVLPLFTNLSLITIEGCDSLCNLGQLSIAGKDCLPQLQELSVRECEMMEQVFLLNKEDQIRNDNESSCITKVFTKLKKVYLHDLPNLVMFYQGMSGIEFPLLTKLSIVKCPKLRSMGSNDDSGGSSQDIDYDSSHLFCQRTKVSFGALKELLLSDQWNPFCGHKIHLSVLNGLEVVKFSKLHGSTSLFSSVVAENLVNMRILNITKCDEMLKVIEDYKEEEKMARGGEMALLFPKLEELQFKNLPKLVTFCDWKCDVKLPLLRKVIMNRCLAMKHLSLGLLAAPNVEVFTTDVNNNLELNGANVSFNNLKKLVIRKSEKPFYGHQFIISLFNGLKELEVYNCRGSMSCLFTSSTARRLHSLEVLWLHDCSEMVKVIEDEENEERLGSGGERTLLFPKLKKLKLMYLPKLESFCERKCDIELPSLRDVIIRDCPVLRIFTKRFISAAPNLENVKTDGGKYDSNRVLRKHLARVEVKMKVMKRKRKMKMKIKGQMDVDQY